MEKNWFECRVSYDKTQENGTIKRITEAYLVDAVNFTEAEKRITEAMQPFISGEFTVSAVRRRNYESVLVGTEGDYYYRVKLVIITIDEKTAAEKKSNLFLLVQADSLEKAVGITQNSMRNSMADWQFHTVTETQIVDVFKYEMGV
jgi:hypothetical protein